MIVNFYFKRVTEYVSYETDYDYLLFSEDDQTYEPTVFNSIYELMNNKNPKRIYSKISWCQEHWCELRGKIRFTVDCNQNFVWGAWGVLRSRKEFNMFLKWLKFSRTSESEDTLGYYLCVNLNGQVEVKQSSIHFGRFQNIPK